ncbi:MAG: saccharopine dehydrogenase NADP-binding domain-containing protein [Myxococcales bacterium]|nr:saccharopine dehydrogenase NADP-binding domain-containing protein [Myxococcales bacterium]
MTRSSERAWDIVLFGATGFTGQLVAEELARMTRGKGVRWAIAGRDAVRLREIQASLVGMHPDHGAVGIVVADARDEASLRALARSARVVVTTVGPYTLHGEPLLAACVAEGSHYLDLTGEPGFVKRSRATHGDAARAARIRVVHCCGFDSIPADLGALYTVARLPKGSRKHVRIYVRTRARISGGTWASFLEIAGRAGKRPSRAEGERTSGGAGPWIHAGPRGGQALVWPVVDRDIVRETARCRPDLYGEGFEVQQFMVLKDRRRAIRFAAGLTAAGALARFGPARRWLRSRLPSHAGPDDATRARSSFELTFVGKTVPGEGEATRKVVTRVSGGDPGYTETSRMLAAASVLLATREADLPRAAGVLTPALAFGEVLIDELTRIGLRFEVLEQDGVAAG